MRTPRRDLYNTILSPYLDSVVRVIEDQQDYDANKGSLTVSVWIAPKLYLRIYRFGFIRSPIDHFAGRWRRPRLQLIGRTRKLCRYSNVPWTVSFGPLAYTIFASTNPGVVYPHKQRWPEPHGTLSGVQRMGLSVEEVGLVCQHYATSVTYRLTDERTGRSIGCLTADTPPGC